MVFGGESVFVEAIGGEIPGVGVGGGGAAGVVGAAGAGGAVAATAAHSFGILTFG